MPKSGFTLFLMRVVAPDLFGLVCVCVRFAAAATLTCLRPHVRLCWAWARLRWVGVCSRLITRKSISNRNVSLATLFILVVCARVCVLLASCFLLLFVLSCCLHRLPSSLPSRVLALAIFSFVCVCVFLAAQSAATHHKGTTDSSLRMSHPRRCL